MVQDQSDRKLSDIARIEADYTGRESLNTIFGDKITVLRHADVEEQFQYNINTRTLAVTTNGTGAVTQADSMAQLSTGTDTDGQCSMVSVNVIRYRPGFEGFAIFTCMWDNGGVTGANQYMGAFSSENGYFLGFTGEDFIVCRNQDSVGFPVAREDFNGDGSFDLFDPKKINIFRISWGWLGTAAISFEWMSEKDERWHLIHRMKFANDSILPSVFNPVLPICMDITKTSGSTDIKMHSGSWAGGVNGEDDGVGDRFDTGTVSATTVSTEAVLINFKNVATFQSETNRVEVEGQKVSISSDGTKSTKVKIYKNLTITNPTFTDIDATNSVIQKDVVGTVTPDDDNLLFEYNLAKSDSVLDDISKLDITLHPGETITVTGQSPSNTDINFTIRWKEHF